MPQQQEQAGHNIIDDLDTTEASDLVETEDTTSITKPDSNKSSNKSSSSKKKKQKKSKKATRKQEDEDEEEVDNGGTATSNLASSSIKKKKEEKKKHKHPKDHNDVDPEVAGAATTTSANAPTATVTITNSTRRHARGLLTVTRAPKEPSGLRASDLDLLNNNDNNDNNDDHMDDDHDQNDHHDHDEQQQQQQQDGGDQLEEIEITTDAAETAKEEVGKNQHDDDHTATNGNNGTTTTTTTTTTTNVVASATSNPPPNASLNVLHGSQRGVVATMSLVLNAGLMIYAHVGLSAVVLSNRPPVLGPSTDNLPPPPPPPPPPSSDPPGSDLTGSCNEDDLVIWTTGGGETDRVRHSNFCSREYDNGGCLLDVPCIETCFRETYGYSAGCSSCFAQVPTCSFDTGCALICAADSLSVDCQTCNEPCVAELDVCLGFPPSSSSSSSTRRRHRRRSLQTEEEDDAVDDASCPVVDLDSIDEWYEVYRLTFVDSIQKAWNGDAIFLALLIVVFSGIWPYAKNIILIYAWYAPLTVERRSSILTWLLRLSKYTLVDVFAVMAVLVGVQLELDVAGVDVVTRAEPRPAIIAFFVATLWEFCQIEWTVELQNHDVHYNDRETTENEDNPEGAVEVAHGVGKPEQEARLENGEFLMAMRFRTTLSSNKKIDSLAPSNANGINLWIVFLVLATLITYLSGAIVELVRFTSFGAGSPEGCVKSYNLVTFGNALVSTLARTDSESQAGSWTLYIAYIILVLLLPILVHLLQLILLIASAMVARDGTSGVGMARYKNVCHVASSFFGFSSVEVLLIGIFAIQYRFDKFVSALAGNGNSGFFSVTSTLGPAFYVLIVYAFASGLLQYFIHCAEAEYYRIDPYHKVHLMWTKLFGCWLSKK